MVSFEKQKDFILMKSNLFFPFIFSAVSPQNLSHVKIIVFFFFYKFYSFNFSSTLLV